jgi:hypothetical protein
VAEPRPAYAQSDQWNALYDRLIRLEHEVRDMKSGGGMMPGNPVSGEAGQRMAAIEDQLRRVLARSTRSGGLRKCSSAPGTARGDSTHDRVDLRPAAAARLTTPRAKTAFDFSQYQSRELAELSAEQDVTVRVYRDYEPQRGAPPQVLGTLSGSQLYQQGQFPSAKAAAKPERRGDDGSQPGS